MTPAQRDIVEVNFQFPNYTSGPHMVVVLSCENAIAQEDCFMGIVITSVTNDDDFSYWLRDGMFMKPLAKKSQVRLHLMNVFRNDQIARDCRNQMRIAPFQELLRRINEFTFGHPVEDLAP